MTDDEQDDFNAFRKEKAQAIKDQKKASLHTRTAIANPNPSPKVCARRRLPLPDLLRMRQRGTRQLVGT